MKKVTLDDVRLLPNLIGLGLLTLLALAGAVLGIALAYYGPS